MISTLPEASWMQWWDSLPQGSASASAQEFKGGAEQLRVAQHGKHRGHVWVIHTAGITGQPRWGVSARMHQERWFLGWSYIQCLLLSQHTLHTEHTQHPGWFVLCLQNPLRSCPWKAAVPVARKWSDIRISKSEPPKFWQMGIRVRFKAFKSLLKDNLTCITVHFLIHL